MIIETIRNAHRGYLLIGIGGDGEMVRLQVPLRLAW